MPQWIINMMMTWLHALVGLGILFMVIVASGWIVRWIRDIEHQNALNRKIQTRFDGGNS